MIAILVVLAWILAVLWLMLAISQTALDYTVLRPCLVTVDALESRC
jgi:hypothetical protein